VTVTLVPQLFLRSDYRYAHQALMDSGFWSPLMWMTRSSVSLSAGYYFSLMGRKYWTIGSGADCNIALQDTLISSQHALLLATADREIYFSDLQSVNGSFVNEQQVIHPVRLIHGDLLKIGPYEIEFQNSGELSIDEPPITHKSVLLLQSSEFQAKIWQEILLAFSVSVQYKKQLDQPLDDEIEALITALDELPDLLIADVDTLKPNPYGFCRWCRDHHPHLRIILTRSDHKEIFESEKRWAIQQGAFNFLPGFPQESPWAYLPDIVERVECVLQAINSQVLQEGTLEPILRSLMQKPGFKPRTDLEPPASE
jgi:predicted component of type VI protein secretion system